MTLSDNKVIRLEFYKLIRLEVLSSGQAYLDVIRDELTKDGLWDYVSTKLVATVTDAAANMVAGNKGFVNLLKKAIGKDDLITHKCLAHRLETVLKHSYKLCPNCELVNLLLKELYSFYSRSPKRNDSLQKLCDRNNKNRFKPRRVLVVRWVASHFIAGRIVYLNYNTIVEHMDHILDSEVFGAPSDKKTRILAKKIKDVMMDKHVFATLGLQLDLMYSFKGISQLFQVKGQSLIGQYSKKPSLLNQIEIIRSDGGTYMDDVIEGSLCGDGETKESCTSLQEYEAKTVTRNNKVMTGAKVVTVQSKPLCVQYQEGEESISELAELDCQVPMEEDELSDWDLLDLSMEEDETSDLDPQEKMKAKRAAVAKNEEDDEEEEESNEEDSEKCKKKKKKKFAFTAESAVLVSSFKEVYLDSIISNIDSYFPSDGLSQVMESLDQTEWPFRVREILANDDVKEFWEKWPEFFGMPEEAAQTIKEDMEKVVDFLEENVDFWCGTHKSKPNEFWIRLLNEFEDMPANLENLLLATLSLPFGGADVERSFSYLNDLLTLKRVRMKPKLADALLRIKMSSDTFKTFDFNKATDHYAQDHEVCDARNRLLNQRKPKPPASSQSAAETSDSSATSSSCQSVEKEVQAIQNDREPWIPLESSLGEPLDRKDRSECFLIVSKISGKVLTAFDNNVGLWSWRETDDQLWFWSDALIVSHASGKVLEVDVIKETPAYLNFYLPGNDRQKWTSIAKIESLDVLLQSNYQEYKLDVLDDVVDNGSTVGSSKRRNVMTQHWKIEPLNQYY